MKDIFLILLGGAGVYYFMTRNNSAAPAPAAATISVSATPTTSISATLPVRQPASTQSFGNTMDNYFANIKNDFTPATATGGATAMMPTLPSGIIGAQAQPVQSSYALFSGDEMKKEWQTFR